MIGCGRYIMICAEDENKGALSVVITDIRFSSELPRPDMLIEFKGRFVPIFGTSSTQCGPAVPQYVFDALRAWDAQLRLERGK